jgi:hypothetical protein
VTQANNSAVKMNKAAIDNLLSTEALDLARSREALEPVHRFLLDGPIVEPEVAARRGYHVAMIFRQYALLNAQLCDIEVAVLITMAESHRLLDVARQQRSVMGG